MAPRPPDIAGITGWAPLARGGFATVWQAHQESLDRPVAVKVDDRRLDSPSERRRFLGEAEAAGGLSGHPGIVTVHDAGILEDGRPYLVMDLCPGGSLTKWLQPGNRQSVDRVREVGVQIAGALAAAHARGMLHRDVKPANILIDRYGRYGLADFGLAALPEADAGSGGEPMTPAYAPLEVIRRQTPSPAGDIYQLAATLYALLSGTAPYPVTSATPSIEELEHLHDHPVAPLPDVDPALMRVIMSGLADDPAARPTAVEFRDRLSAVSLPAGNTATGARPDAADLPPADGPATAAPRRRRRLLSVVIGAVVAVLLISLGAGAIYVYQIDRSVTANITRGFELPDEIEPGAPRPVKDPRAESALNYVLIGTDDGEIDRDGRSDSIMIMHLNTDRDAAYIISFPRDMWVSIPGHGTNTINAAYAIGGPTLVVQTLERLTKTRMDHVATIDFEGFISLTEDLGGVTVNNRVAFSTHGFDYPKGRIEMSGEKALWFVRERNQLPSELARAENQRNVLKAILTKGVSTEVISDPVRFTTFIANAAKRVKVDNNLTNGEIRSTTLSLRLRPSSIKLLSAPLLSGTDRRDRRTVHQVDGPKMAELGDALRTDGMADYNDR